MRRYAASLVFVVVLYSAVFVGTGPSALATSCVVPPEECRDYTGEDDGLGLYVVVVAVSLVAGFLVLEAMTRKYRVQMDGSRRLGGQ